MKNPMNDKDFLKQLDLQKNKETFIKIYSLSFEEEPREEIEGKITSGSINIDGTSAVRRTCSLSLVADNININDYLWALNTKIRIYIGIKNNINSEYEDIIWFNQGIYILTSFSVTYNTNSYIINLSGQDKMCLLNGSVEGILPASIDFKQSVRDSIIYKEVDLGLKYIPEMYQIVDESIITLDTSETYDENKDYLIKYHKEYKEVSLKEDEYVKNKYYIEKEEYIDLKKYLNITAYTSSTYDTYIKNKNINIYTLENQEYTLVDFSNVSNFSFDSSKTYYILTDYTAVTTSTIFDEFEQYYTCDNGYFNPIYLDKTTFDSNKYLGNYFYNTEYQICTDSFSEEESYYTLKDGYYSDVSLNSVTYSKEKYFYNKIITFTNAPTEFNKNLKYYDLDGNKVDFFEQVYNTYQSNKYYIKNALQTEFIKYPYEYNPSLTYYEKKTYSETEDIPIKTIIKEAVHTYGKEPYYNIIINDVDDEGLLLKEYIGEDPLFLLVNNGICENISSNDQVCYVIGQNVGSDIINLYIDLIEDELKRIKVKLNQHEITQEEYKKLRENFIKVLINGINAQETVVSDSDLITYNTFIDDFDLDPSQVLFINDNNDNLDIYTILKLENGDAAGYELTELTYPNELISSAGDTLTSVLDKIKDTLSNFEYFYDVDGRFIFQKKKTYLNTSWNNIITQEDETYVTSAADVSETQYTFDDNELIISIGNSVKLDNLKNDYSLWGTRKTINDVEIPIHARYAIDIKPYAYVTFPRVSYNYVDQQDELQIETINNLDYLVQNIYINSEYFETIINDLDLIVTDEESIEEDITYDYYKIRINPTRYNDVMYAGIYYNIISCDWREIIYQMALDYYKHNQENDFLAKLAEYNTFNVEDEYSEDNYLMQQLDKNAGKLYPEGVTGYEQYYIDMEAYWRDIYNTEPEIDIGFNGGYYSNKEWQEVVEDYSQFNCDYYLPLSQYDKYADLLDLSIVDYEKKIADLEDQINNYNQYTELDNLLEALSENQTLLDEAKEQKTLLLKSYYTQKLFVFNDSEYRKIMEEYNKLESERNTYINDIEAQILSILKNDFELY